MRIANILLSDWAGLLAGCEEDERPAVLMGLADELGEREAAWLRTVAGLLRPSGWSEWERAAQAEWEWPAWQTQEFCNKYGEGFSTLDHNNSVRNSVLPDWLFGRLSGKFGTMRSGWVKYRDEVDAWHELLEALVRP